jgi:hypothetical protein
LIVDADDDIDTNGVDWQVVVKNYLPFDTTIHFHGIAYELSLPPLRRAAMLTIIKTTGYALVGRRSWSHAATDTNWGRVYTEVDSY